MSTHNDVNTTKHSAFSSRPVRNKAVSLGTCAMHATPATMKDAFGNVWCDACKHRYDFVTWGKEHGFPSLHVHPYAIEAGEWFWQANVIIANDERIKTLLNEVQGGSNEEE